MTHIPKKILQEILSDPGYKICARYNHLDHICEGRITFEHAIIYAGKQVQEKWAIIPLCAKAHNVDDWQDRGDLYKELSVWIALNQATDEDLANFKGTYHVDTKRWLNAKYGVWVHPYHDFKFLLK